MTKVSGTILFDDGKNSSFLVKESNPYQFLSTYIEENKTALATMLTFFKGNMGIPVDCLRLEELAMLKGTKKQSLFVFSIHDQKEKIEQKLKSNSSAEFVDVSKLASLFDTVEIDTAPFFE